MKQHLNKNVLVTTGAYFIAPDGKEYRAIWGELKAIHEAGATLGFIPNRSHANWFVEIGNTIVMGCQVLYFIACEDPNLGRATNWESGTDGGTSKEYEHPSKIYNANT